jgi:hypothetical protein
LTSWHKIKHSITANPLNTQIFYYSRQLDKFHRGRNEKAFKVLDKQITEEWFDLFLLHSSEEPTDVEDDLFEWFSSILWYFLEPKRIEWQREVKMYRKIKMGKEQKCCYN